MWSLRRYRSLGDSVRALRYQTAAFRRVRTPLLRSAAQLMQAQPCQVPASGGESSRSTLPPAGAGWAEHYSGQHRRKFWRNNSTGESSGRVRKTKATRTIRCTNRLSKYRSGQKHSRLMLASNVKNCACLFSTSTGATNIDLESCSG